MKEELELNEIIDEIFESLKFAKIKRSKFVRFMELQNDPYIVLIACILSLRTNDITTYPQQTLNNAINKLTQILKVDLPEILRLSGKQNLRVCVIPRSKRENSYRCNQLYLRATIQLVTQQLNGFIDGTHDIIRHTDTATTHLARSGHGGAGELPYVGITKDTCNISDDIIGQDILLIDDLYTKTVNIDEDCIQALLDKGARSVIFYSIGKTLSRF